MPRPLTRNEKISIVFMVVWLIFWAGGMMIMVVALGGAVLAGDFAALGFMVIWLAAAGFGLVSGARNLRRLLLREGPVRRPPVSQPWNDGMAERPEPKPEEGSRPGRFDRL